MFYRLLTPVTLLLIVTITKNVFI